MNVDQLQEAIRLGDKILLIEKDKDIPWRDKYEFIFSIYKGLAIQGFYIEWFDPDMAYEDDVRSFCRALKENLKIWKHVYKIMSSDVGYNIPF